MNLLAVTFVVAVFNLLLVKYIKSEFKVEGGAAHVVAVFFVIIFDMALFSILRA